MLIILFSYAFACQDLLIKYREFLYFLIIFVGSGFIYATDLFKELGFEFLSLI